MKPKAAICGASAMENDLELSLRRLGEAVRELEFSMDVAADRWAVSAVPGIWSPAQIVEHVARIMEESGRAANGLPSKFPTVAPLLRPIGRVLVFGRILRRNRFLRMKAIDAFDPASGPSSPAEGRVRLSDALERFDASCRDQARRGEDVPSTIFGRVGVANFVRFQELHVRHHTAQLCNGVVDDVR